MKNDELLKHLKQLEKTIEKTKDAIEDVDIHCGDYSNTDEEVQEEVMEKLVFYKFQLRSRMEYLISYLGE